MLALSLIAGVVMLAVAFAFCRAASYSLWKTGRQIAKNRRGLAEIDARLAENRTLRERIDRDRDERLRQRAARVRS